MVAAGRGVVNQPDDRERPPRGRGYPCAVPELPPEDAKTKAQLPELQQAHHGLRRRVSAVLVPHEGPVDGEQPSAAGKSGTLRAAIFGVNDGLVSNAALIMGFAGASQPRDVILLAGISGLLAGAFSMAAGEYISMKVQRELLERMLHLEAHELGSDHEGELGELAEIYERKGLEPALARQVATQLMADPQVALDTHAREELGIDPDEGLGSPRGAATSSFFTFAIGAFVPLMPFLFAAGTAGTLLSLGVTAAALLSVGGATSRLTGRSVGRSAFRMFATGMGAAAVTYAIGSLLGVSVVG
jgi:vacuolar iron transporter family protein